MPHSADELLRRHARLLSERVVWESHWAEVAQHVLPRSDFFMGRRNPGEKHTEKIVSVRRTTSPDLGGAYFSTWRECHAIGVSSAARFARTSLSPGNTLCR